MDCIVRYSNVTQDNARLQKEVKFRIQGMKSGIDQTNKGTKTSTYGTLPPLLRIPSILPRIRIHFLQHRYRQNMHVGRYLPVLTYIYFYSFNFSDPLLTV